ncbi:MAG: hypothetical protein HN580_23585 [Deltaproteobacteria bacterium]|nr:hypothetical protein [Deltaproteobacteria bacterium]MBT7892019.1 hypothetical protein [Deltaproteobacteria bacterium]
MMEVSENSKVSLGESKVSFPMYRRSFGKIFALLALLLTVFLTIILWIYSEEENKALLNRNKTVLNHTVHMIGQDLDNVVSDLNLLSKSLNLRRWLRLKDADSLRRFQEEILIFARHKPHFDQVRFLNTGGMEIIRINQNIGHPTVTPVGMLQNKKDRHYFKETLALSSGEISLSPLNLNLEHGEIEIPFKPTLRFGLTIHDKTAQKRGVLILNYLAEYFLGDVESVSDISRSNTMFLNGKGYWFYSLNPADEWGFMLGHNKTFPNRYPQAWSTISKQDDGIVNTSAGRFVFKAFYPMEVIQRAAYADASDRVMQRNPKKFRWILASKTSNNPLTSLTGSDQKLFAISYCGLLFALFLFSCFFARIRARKKAVEDDLANKSVLLQTTLDSVQQGLLAYDDDLRLIICNHRLREMLGISEELARPGTPVPGWIRYDEELGDFNPEISEEFPKGSEINNLVFYPRGESV